MSPSPESEDVSGQQRRRRDARSSGPASPGSEDSSWADVVGVNGAPSWAEGGAEAEESAFFEPRPRRDRSNRQQDDGGGSATSTPPSGNPAGVDAHRPWWAGAGGSGGGQSSPFQPGSAFGSAPAPSQPVPPPAAPTPAPPAQAPGPATGDFFTPATPAHQPQSFDSPSYEPPSYEPPSPPAPSYGQPYEPPSYGSPSVPDRTAAATPAPAEPAPPAEPTAPVVPSFAPPTPVAGPSAFSQPTAFRPSASPAPFEPPPSFGARRAEAPPSFGRPAAPQPPETRNPAPRNPTAQNPATPTPAPSRELPEYQQPRFGGPVYTPPTYDEFPSGRGEFESPGGSSEHRDEFGADRWGFDPAPPTGTTPVVRSGDLPPPDFTAPLDFPAPLEPPAPLNPPLTSTSHRPAPWESAPSAPSGGGAQSPLRDPLTGSAPIIPGSAPVDPPGTTRPSSISPLPPLDDPLTSPLPLLQSPQAPTAPSAPSQPPAPAPRPSTPPSGPRDVGASDETGPIDLPTTGFEQPPRRTLAERARERRGSGLAGGLTGGIGALRRSATGAGPAASSAGAAAATGAAASAAASAAGQAATAGAAGAAASSAVSAAASAAGALSGALPSPASPPPESPAYGNPFSRRAKPRDEKPRSTGRRGGTGAGPGVDDEAPPTGALPSFNDVLTGPIQLPGAAGAGRPPGDGPRSPKGRPAKVRRPRNDEPMLEPMGAPTGAPTGPAPDGPVSYGETMLPLDEAHEQQMEAEAAAAAEAARQSHGPGGLRMPAPAPATGKAGRNLPAAIAVGVGLGALAAGSLFTRPEAFVATVSVVVVLALWEIAGAMAAKDIMVPVMPLAVGSVGMLVSAYVAGQEGLLVSFTLTGFGLLLWRIIDGVEGAAGDFTAGLFVAAYVPLLAAFAILMLADGPMYVVTFIVVTVSSDIGGYALGVVAGKHPMAPTVSPKKSWEGFAGSVIACLAVGAATVTFLLDGDPLVGLALGAATVVSATLGDLAESLLKRDLNVKDMGNLLPGHGGLMDRLDSLLPTAPLAFLILHQFVALAS